MSLTSDQITICNLALGEIGEYEITATNTSEKQYKLCERFYSEVVEQVISEHPWNEAKTRTVVMQDTTAPLFGYVYRFSAPSDCIETGVLRIGDGDGDWSHWEVENGYILTDRAQTPLSYSADKVYVAGQYITYESVTYLVDTGFTASGTFSTDATSYLTSQGGDYMVLYVEYLFVPDISDWSASLKNVITQRLAQKIITPITNNPKYKLALINEQQTITLPAARSSDAREGRPRKLFKSRWWKSRYGP